MTPLILLVLGIVDKALEIALIRLRHLPPEAHEALWEREQKFLQPLLDWLDKVLPKVEPAKPDPK